MSLEMMWMMTCNGLQEVQHAGKRQRIEVQNEDLLQVDVNDAMLLQDFVDVPLI